MEILQSGEQTERQMDKYKSNVWDLWNNIKYANLCVIEVPEEEERQKGIENVFEEIMAENFPNLWKETDIQVGKLKDFQTRRTQRHSH